MSNKAISRWETGEGFPEISLLTTLADTLGVTVDFLLTEADPEEKTNEKELHGESILKQLRWKNLHGFNKLAFLSSAGAFIAFVVYTLFVLIITTFDIFPTEQAVSMIPLLMVPFTNLLPKIGFISALIGLALGFFGKIAAQTATSIILIISNLFIIIGLPVLLFMGLTLFETII